MEHFPGRPVVPGSVIVNTFIELGRQCGLCGDEWVVRDFRFRGFVSPGEHAFHLNPESDGLKCRLFQGETDGSKILVTGTIER